MADLLGFIGILIVVACIAIVCRRWPAVALPLCAAFAVRLAALLSHHYIHPLPDSGADAVTFERVAWEWAQQPLGLQFLEDHSYLISWLLGLFYRITDRSPLMGQAMSLFFGMGAVFLGWYLARMLWGNKVARRAVWVMAFFPTLVLYSAIIMREAYVWFFAVLALIGVVRWVRTRRSSAMVLALAGFAGAAAFHGGMAVGALAFLGLVWVESLRRVASKLLHWRLAVVSFGVVLLALPPLVAVLVGAVELPKLGAANEINVELLLLTGESVARDGAAYPSFVIANSPAELYWKAPLRVAYFLFSPFPWDIRSPHQLIGLLDGILYIGLACLVYFNRKVLWADPAAKWVFTIVLAIAVVFAFGVGNFGTALRHRGKILIALIVLAAPKLRGFSLGRRAR